MRPISCEHNECSQRQVKRNQKNSKKHVGWEDRGTKESVDKLHRRPQTVRAFQKRNTLQLELATSRAGRQRIARQRRTQQSELGVNCKLRIAMHRLQATCPELGDKCKGLQGRAVQSWETNVKGLKREGERGVQSWEAHVKDCKAEEDTAAQRTRPESPLHVPASSALLCPPLPRNPFQCLPALGCSVRLCLAILHISSGLLCPPLACNPVHLSQLLYPPLPCSHVCHPALSCCVRLCLAILYICLQLWAAVSASDKKGDKGKQKADKADTVTNKKADKTGDKGRQKGDKADTVTNKKGDKKGNKRRQKGDMVDTVTNKKGDKTGDKGRQEGDKADTMTNNKGGTVTNKKGDKTGDTGRQEGDQADTMTNKKGDRG